MGNTIYASFADPDHAERAAGALLDFGLSPHDVSLVQSHRGEAPPVHPLTPTETWTATPPSLSEAVVGLPNRLTTLSASEVMSPAVEIGPVGTWDGYAETDDQLEESAKHGISVTSAADAEAGAFKGAAWGTGVGVIAAAASLVVPGFGLILGAGALAIAIAGIVGSAGAGAAAGAMTGYLKDQGVESHVVEHFHSTLHGGGALLAVTVPSGPVGEAEAKSLLEKYGASSVSAYSEAPPIS